MLPHKLSIHCADFPPRREVRLPIGDEPREPYEAIGWRSRLAENGDDVAQGLTHLPGEVVGLESCCLRIPADLARDDDDAPRHRQAVTVPARMRPPLRQQKLRVTSRSQAHRLPPSSLNR